MRREGLFGGRAGWGSGGVGDEGLVFLEVMLLEGLLWVSGRLREVGASGGGLLVVPEKEVIKLSEVWICVDLHLTITLIL